MLPIQQAILQTLKYHAAFNYPLTLDELHRLLITKHPVSQNEVKKDLVNLVKKAKVKQVSKYYFLPTPTTKLTTHNSQLITLRQSRAIASKKKLQITAKAAKLFAHLPWVRLICVTGALAMESSDQEDDIDLMIVTAKNRLWLTRPLVVFLTLFLFKKRKPIPHPHNQTHNPQLTTHNKDALCLNLWLDETALLIPPNKHNLVTAHELAQMKPLINKGKTYERMIGENRWATNFLANAWEAQKLTHNSYSRLNSLNSLNPLNLMNYFLFLLQRLYMRPRRTTEQVSLNRAFFHPENPHGLPRRSEAISHVPLSGAKADKHPPQGVILKPGDRRSKSRRQSKPS